MRNQSLEVIGAICADDRRLDATKEQNRHGDLRCGNAGACLESVQVGIDGCSRRRICRRAGPSGDIGRIGDQIGIPTPVPAVAAPPQDALDAIADHRAASGIVGLDRLDGVLEVREAIDSGVEEFEYFAGTPRLERWNDIDKYQCTGSRGVLALGDERRHPTY